MLTGGLTLRTLFFTKPLMPTPAIYEPKELEAIYEPKEPEAIPAQSQASSAVATTSAIMKALMSKAR